MEIGGWVCIFWRWGPPRRRLSTVYLDGVVHACAAALVHPSVQTASPYQCTENLLLDIGDALSRAPNGHLIAVDQDAAIGRIAPEVPDAVLDARPAGLRTRRCIMAAGANRRQHNDQPCSR